MALLNESFNPKPKPPIGPRQSGQTVTNPRALAAIAIKNSLANNAVLNQPSPLAQAINKRKKKGY